MNQTVQVLIVIVATLVLFSFLFSIVNFLENRRAKNEKPEQPAAPDNRCPATTNIGFPLPMPAMCWREAGHERYGMKHYAEKGDGTVFKAEW